MSKGTKASNHASGKDHDRVHDCDDEYNSAEEMVNSKGSFENFGAGDDKRKFERENEKLFKQINLEKTLNSQENGIDGKAGLVIGRHEGNGIKMKDSSKQTEDGIFPIFSFFLHQFSTYFSNSLMLNLCLETINIIELTEKQQQ